MNDGAALEKIREKKRRRWLRNAILLCAALTLLLLWLTGLGSIYADRIGNRIETLQIRLKPGSGLPVTAQADFSTQFAALREALVWTDDNETTVYSASGKLLRNFQHSYANPCLTAGKNRFCIYNQGGRELQIEGRTRSYGNLTAQGNIWFAQMSSADTLAVVTQSDSYLGTLTVYTDNLEKLFSWHCASAYPVTAAFAPDGRQLVVCGTFASGGVCNTAVYIVGASGEKAKIERADSLVLQAAWLSGSRVVVAYEDALVLYDADNLEQLASYAMTQPLLCCCLTAKDGPVLVNGDVGSDAGVTVTMLSRTLALQREAEVDAAELPREGSKMRWQCLQQGNRVWLLGNRKVFGFSRGRHKNNDAVWELSHQAVGLAGSRALYLLTVDECTVYDPDKTG